MSDLRKPAPGQIRGESAVAVKTVLRILSAWGLDEAQMRLLLRAPDEPTFIGWRNGNVGKV